MPKREKQRIARTLLAAAVLLCASFGLAALETGEAFAYSYRTTNTTSIYNRAWIRVDPSANYLELIGSDPIGPRFDMPSWNAPGGIHSRIEAYQFAVWSVANGQDDLAWYSGGNGRWTRAGAVMGSGKLDGSGNGNGFGCIATYGYGWGGSVVSKHGGFDALMACHVYLTNADYGLNNYGYVDFWPRVKIAYDANGGTGAPAAHYKYIGTTANISSQKPTRVGYTFEGWSTVKNGAVDIAPGQKVGYEDWNLQQCSNIPHDWEGTHPTAFFRDPSAGQPLPSGSNVIPLYAVWKPISYTVSYNGNGATSGSTASSSHVYDAAKTLTSNGFRRSYALTCDAQGGSAGVTRLDCTWKWKSWNTRVDGGGASYGNRASVRNLRTTTGTTNLYAQWSEGVVELPDPGTKADCAFKGWYDAPSGGSPIGKAGDRVSIGSSTTYYAQWQPYARIAYYADGAGSPVFSESVEAGTAYRANARAAAQATRPDCAGFDGWYLDAACTQPFVEGSAVPEAGLALYGRNRVRVSYAPTDRTVALFADRELFADEGGLRPLAHGVELPQARELFYGERLSFDRGGSAWFEQHDRMREATCEPGAYATPAGEGGLARSARITRNTVAYLQWSVPVYDGIALS